MSIDTDAHKREMQNIGTTPNTTSAFQREWIDAMVARTYTLRKTVQHIFVTIDPSAGKDRNYYALLSTIFVDNQCVVCTRSCCATPPPPSPPASAAKFRAALRR